MRATRCFDTVLGGVTRQFLPVVWSASRKAGTAAATLPARILRPGVTSGGILTPACIARAILVSRASRRPASR